MGPDRSEVRASDADRALVADALRTHCVEGRLGVDELEHRLAAALSARLIGELEPLLSDLPAAERSARAPAGRQPGRRIAPGLPGVRTFRQDHVLHAARERVFREFRADVVPTMVASGYDVVGLVENELVVFERDRERVVVSVSDRGEGRTRLTVQGRAPLAVRRAFANIAAERGH